MKALRPCWCAVSLIPMVLLLGRGWLEPMLFEANMSWAKFSTLLWMMGGMILGGGMGSFMTALYVGNQRQDQLARIVLLCFPVSVAARYLGARYAALPGFVVVTSAYYLLMGVVLWRMVNHREVPGNA